MCPCTFGRVLSLTSSDAQMESVCSASLHTHQYFNDTLTHSSLDETSLERNLLLVSVSLQYLLIRVFPIPLLCLTVWCLSKSAKSKVWPSHVTTHPPRKRRRSALLTSLLMCPLYGGLVTDCFGLKVTDQGDVIKHRTSKKFLLAPLIRQNIHQQ